RGPTDAAAAGRPDGAASLGARRSFESREDSGVVARGAGAAVPAAEQLARIWRGRRCRRRVSEIILSSRGQIASVRSAQRDDEGPSQRGRRDRRDRVSAGGNTRGPDQSELGFAVAGASPKKVFTCQLCGKVLCSKASLKRHIADKHAERQEEYRCVICERPPHAPLCRRPATNTTTTLPVVLPLARLHAAAGAGAPPPPWRCTLAVAGTVRMPPPTSGGINEPQECPYCRRTFSCYYSLKRHFQDKHEQSDTLYVCEFCHRRYRTKNSLTTHKSLQHRGSSGMLKRLLKTTAIKSVLGTPPPPRLQ
ncbi:hypothetical protein BDFB_007235, partial [Asbolus verrucosus]